MALEQFIQKAGRNLRRSIIPTIAGMMLTTSCILTSCEKEPEPQPTPPTPPAKVMTITGQIKNEPHNAYLSADVVAKDKENRILEVTKANAQGQYTLKIEGERDQIKLNISYNDKHETRDTTLNWGNHTINKTLPVIPITDSIQYNITAIDNANDNKIKDALVTLYANPSSGNLGDSITSGLTDSQGVHKGKIEQTRWIHNNDTINKINTILTEAKKENYETLQLTDTLKNELIKTMHMQPKSTNPPIYEYTIPISLTSTNPEKTPISFRAYIRKENAPIGDTLAVKNIQGTTGNITLHYSEPNLNIEIGAINIPHFENTKKNTTINQGTTNETVSTNPITYTYNITGNVLYENTNPVNATLTTEGKTTTTNQQGGYTLANIPQQTNNNNEPQTHEKQISATGNFEEQIKTITADGQNKNVNFTIPNPIYELWLFSQNSTPNNTTITGWKNGEPIITATVQNNTYETNKITSENTTTTLDSLIKKLDGHITQKEINYIITQGGQKHDFNLETTPTTPTKTLNFTFKPLQVTGDPQHPQNKYEITFGNQTQIITIGMQNEINVNITANITDGNDNVIIRNIPYEASPNTPIDNDVIMIAYQNRDAFERAFVANQMYANAKYSNDQRNHLEVELDQINNKHNLEFLSTQNYFVEGEHFFSTTQSDTIFMNTIIPNQILSIKSSGLSTQWEPYNYNGTLIDKVQIVHVKAVEQTNEPLGSNITDPSDYAINLITQGSYRRDGQPTMKYEILEFNSYEDPAYKELANREPANRNTVRIIYDNSVTMATNSTGHLSGGIIARGLVRNPPTILSTSNTSEEVDEALYSKANPTSAPGTTSGVFTFTYDHTGKIVYSEMGYTINMFRQHFPKDQKYVIAPPN
jgi:hypothetical protein